MKTLVLCIVLLLPRSAVISQTWEATSPLTGSSVSSLCANRNGVLFAAVDPEWASATRGGMYMSTDEGESWAYFSAEFGTIPFITRLPNGEMFLNRLESASGVSPLIYRSTDDGYSWKTVPLSVRISCMVSKSPDTLLIGTPTGGLYRSVNNDSTWAQILFAENIFALAVTPEGDILAGTRHGLYRSTDNGLSWDYSATDPSRIDFLSVTSTGTVIALARGKMRRSYDGGNTWTAAAFPESVITVLTMDGDNMVFAGTSYNGVYFSSDTGHTWRNITPNYFRMPVKSIYKKGQYVFVTTQYGVHRTRLDNETHAWIHPRLDTLDIWNFRISPRGTMYVTTWPPYSTPPGTRGFYSTDLGEEWLSFSPNRDLWPWIADSAGTCIAYDDTVVYISRDDGVVWQPYTTMPMRFRWLTQRNSREWYGLRSDTIYQSTDSGRTWRHLPSPPDTTLFSVYVTADGTLLANVASWDDEQRLYRSTNHGITWTRDDNGPDGYYLNFLEAGGGVLFAYVEYTNRFYRSPDNGIHWELTFAPESSDIFMMNRHSGGTLFLACHTGLYYSTDRGAAWNTYETGNATLIPRIIQEGPDGRIYASTRNGRIYRAPAALTTVEERREETPQEYKLFQNYPNPFNPLTHLQFTIVNLQFVTLKVYNILGQEVATLVNEMKQPGTYTVEWNAAGQPSGMYFYKIVAGKQSGVRRMLLVK